MKRIFLIVFLPLILVILSCDKEKSTSKKLNGDWELKQYKITLLDGISEFAVCTGELKISTTDFEDFNNSFMLQLNYEFPSITGSSIEAGYLRIKQKGDFMDASYRDGGNTESHILEYRIMVLNKTDLQIEYRDTNNLVNYLTFRKI